MHIHLMTKAAGDMRLKGVARARYSFIDELSQRTFEEVAATEVAGVQVEVSMRA
jgi:hypothetical protein